MVALLLSACKGVSLGKGTVVEPLTPEGGKETKPTPVPELPPASKVILMDGEMVAASPSLDLSFAGNVSAELLTLDATIGQRVREGDLIATLDDGDLQQAVVDAQLTLDRAIANAIAFGSMTRESGVDVDAVADDVAGQVVVGQRDAGDAQVSVVGAPHGVEEVRHVA